MSGAAGTDSPDGRGVVVAVFAHPDDEGLIAGGTLAACASAGLEVVLWSLTRGEQGPIAQPARTSRASLGAVRETELLGAGQALGAAAVECLGYPDGELASVDPAVAAADLGRRLRALRPRAVITFGPEGLYWHPDHVATHEITMGAVDEVGTDGLEPWVYWATWPVGRMAELVSAVAARGRTTSLWGLEPAAFGAPPSSITTVVDVRRFLGVKLRALRIHQSQLPADHLFLVLPDDLAERFLGVEHFVRARGRGSTNEDWLTAVVAVGGLGRASPA